MNTNHNFLISNIMDKKIPKTIRITRTNYLRDDYDRDGIKTEKFVETEIFYNESGKVLKENHYSAENEIESMVENQYNDHGLVSSSSQYDQNHELCQKNIFSYDEQQRIIRKGCFYGEESPEYATHYVYENGLLVREDSYDEDEFAYTEKEYTYDDHGSIIKLIEYDEDGEIMYRTTNEYDEKQQLIKRTREELLEHDSRTFTFQYDERGNKTKELLYNYDMRLIAKAYYQYDEADNCVVMEEENLDIYRKTTYAYCNGNCVKITQYDKEDKLLTWTDYTYNENNDIVRVQNNIADEVSPEEYRIAFIVEYETEWY